MQAGHTSSRPSSSEFCHSDQIGVFPPSYETPMLVGRCLGFELPLTALLLLLPRRFLFHFPSSCYVAIITHAHAARRGVTRRADADRDRGSDRDRRPADRGEQRPPAAWWRRREMQRSYERRRWLRDGGNGGAGLLRRGACCCGVRIIHFFYSLRPPLLLGRRQREQPPTTAAFFPFAAPRSSR